MDLCWLILLLLGLGSVNTFAQDVSSKSASKVSDFKAKLAKTELSAKQSDAVKSDSDPVSISDLGISVPPEYANETIKKDHHTYYNSTFYSHPDEAKQFWIKLEGSNVVTHEKLSDSYRQATTVELSFDFPFYGTSLRNVTIATGGFLYMGDYLHNWIAATQYIAPLMANFDTRLSSDSLIKHLDNGTAFTVQWEKVFIQDRQSEGAFTFQATLFQSGDIVFAYKDIPYAVSSISDSQHPVKVGLSDAYILEKSLLFIRRKTVYEYNRIHITKWDISNDTALYFTALPICGSFKDCSTCISKSTESILECSWCEAVKRCSDGIDRLRQSWIDNGCTVNKATTCSALGTTPSTDKTEISIFTNKVTDGTSLSNKDSTSRTAYSVDSSTKANDVFDSKESSAHWKNEVNTSETKSSASAGAIATILVFLIVIVSVSIWVFYAYKNPQSSSGQFLIKYRPAQWGLKKDGTVATSNSRHF